MKFDCGPTFSEIIESRKLWHRWFAWRPVRVGPRDCRWLEYVERKGTSHFSPHDDWWTWEFRPIPLDK